VNDKFQLDEVVRVNRPGKYRHGELCEVIETRSLNEDGEAKRKRSVLYRVEFADGYTTQLLEAQIEKFDIPELEELP